MNRRINTTRSGRLARELRRSEMSSEPRAQRWRGNVERREMAWYRLRLGSRREFRGGLCF